MKFVLVDNSTLMIEHQSFKPIKANIREFSNTRLIRDYQWGAEGGSQNPFKVVNDFLRYCIPLSDQDKLFKCYQEIASEFQDGFFDIDLISEFITERFNIIYSIVKVDDMEEFMNRTNAYLIPPNINKTYTGEYDESRTYIEPKYKGLIALAMCGRFALPIWGELAPIRKSGDGARRVPVYLLKLLQESDIVKSRQFNDFEKYVIATVEAGKFKPGRISAGFGTEYNITLNLASNFVKKVATTPNSEKNQLAQDIYNFIANDGAYNDASSGEEVWMKKDPSALEERSLLGKYALRETMSQGDISMIEHYLSEPKRILGHILIDTPPEEIDAMLPQIWDQVKHFEEVDFIPDPNNLLICQWMMAIVVPPKTITYSGYYFQRVTVACCMGILRYLGYPQQVAILASYLAKGSDNFIVSTKATRKQMPAELDEELNRIYPLSRKVKGQDYGNMAKVAVNNLHTEISDYVLGVQASPFYVQYLKEQKILNNHLRFGVNGDNPNQLARLLIDLNKINENITRRKRNIA